MAKTPQQSDGIRVLVCGSQRFQDKSFVFGILNGFASVFNIDAVLSGPFSGADAFAREWAKERGIVFEPINIAQSERMELEYFESDRAIPAIALKNDPMFRSGFEKLRDSAATVVLAIPNPDGQLGPTSSCLKRMASLIGIECIDGSQAMRAVSAKMAAAQESRLAAEAPQEPAADRPALAKP